jgi:uncharacterized protein (TIGR02001 family)
MTWRNGEAWIKSCILGVALAAAVALPAQAQDKKLSLSATATFTTDYVFRGISQTAENPALQGSFDATYGIFYLGMWGSNVDFGGAGSTDIASLEIDYYGGITPTWQGISFDIGGIYYTYPGAFDPGGNFDYFELKTGASYTFAEKLTVGVTNYWSPDNTGETGDNDVLEFAASYAFAGKIFNFFSPSVSGLYGHQWGDSSSGGFDYSYWNAGLTLGFMDHWSADIRYWDTDELSCASGVFACDARVVGTVSASF